MAAQSNFCSCVKQFAFNRYDKLYIIFTGKPAIKVSFYSLFQNHSFRGQLLSNPTQGDSTQTLRAMPTLYLSPIQRLRNHFHLFCKQQMEQLQVVFAAVLNCHSSGKGSKRQEELNVRHKSRKYGDSNFIQMYNFTCSFFSAAILQRSLISKHKVLIRGYTWQQEVFLIFSFLACSTSPHRPRTTELSHLIILLHVCLHLSSICFRCLSLPV